ncbi:molybdopterin-binding protein [Amnibacterium flavum]|uniref:MerR family transcriptional regulator n=1 Tax=Amnibacterium flavum TaxID=2173173 RepID=A0A2V1HUX4_9MICO|nr:TOBE domain-containing protein [Amnibacterium flavum]PVZ96405.1 MerR family transcriptional regulator [Amnibacterium flavum]
MTAGRIRISEAAALLGVSDDTIRRWGESGRIEIDRTTPGPATVDGAALASLAVSAAEESTSATLAAGGTSSARNRLAGIVTRVVKDTVMAQVELQAGPFRLVSLMSREAADELGLEVGSIAVASVKATNVVVDLPR